MREAIKSVASDVHAPHPVSSRRGELISSGALAELLLRRLPLHKRCPSTTLSRRVRVGQWATARIVDFQETEERSATNT